MSDSGVKIIQSRIAGCVALEYPVWKDQRGSFIKTFNKSLFQSLELEADFTECFYSISEQRVLRGMHFQRPPADQAKLIYCLGGRILDVALDLRRNSPTMGECATFELSADCYSALYLPRGIAHGFYVRESPAMVVYHVSSEYDPICDSGIHWNSFGFDWPDKDPILSSRDSAFVHLKDFESPFFLQMEASQ